MRECITRNPTEEVVSKVVLMSGIEGKVPSIIAEIGSRPAPLTYKFKGENNIHAQILI